MKTVVLRYFLKGLLLPPASCLLLIGVGVLMRRRWPRLGPLLALAGFIALWALSTPWVAHKLQQHLERVPVMLPAQLDSVQADAIVVLSAGRYLGAAEYDGPRPDALGLQRIEYAAFLAKRSGLPLIVSGGAVLGQGESAAAVMAGSLRDEFGIALVQPEEMSRTTWENAVYSRQLFPPSAKPRVILVTHAWHMPRALWSFEQNGFAVMPAPTRFADSQHHALAVLWFLPSAQALADACIMVHEWLGITVYKWMYS